MFKLVGDAVATVTALKPLVANATHCDIVVAPSYLSIKSVADRLEGSHIQVAAQDLSSETTHGAHTGEVCGDMLRDAGCSHVIIGHSERRALYGDSDPVIHRKVRAALHFGLIPILCCGETLSEREAGREVAVVEGQLQEDLADLTAQEMVGTILAYEPVWAIGTGKTASPVQAQEMHQSIRHWLVQRFDLVTANAVRILYGGSVKPDNISDLMAQPDIDGALVGGASLEADSFSRLVHYHR